MKTTRQIYCQYLLSSQINYTCTNLADHIEGLDHNSVYRYLKEEKISPSVLWEKVKELIVPSERGYLLFDDTVLVKSASYEIEGVRRQYSGSTHSVVKGIGVVNLVYYNAEADQYWVIDYRIFDPERDGKTKLDHVDEMLDSVRHRKIPYKTVLMDSWYATARLMTRLIREGKLFYCPIKKNRKVDESGGETPYVPVESLSWTTEELRIGKTVKLYKFPGATKLKLFRVSVSSHRTEFLVTNEETQSDTEAAQKESARRWKVEQFHREEKQLTGVGKCECRLNRSQRNHIGCARLVWTCLKRRPTI
jgi:hypothetical protein